MQKLSRLVQPPTSEGATDVRDSFHDLVEDSDQSNSCRKENQHRISANGGSNSDRTPKSTNSSSKFKRNKHSSKDVKHSSNAKDSDSDKHWEGGSRCKHLQDAKHSSNTKGSDSDEHWKGERKLSQIQSECNYNHRHITIEERYADLRFTVKVFLENITLVCVTFAAVHIVRNLIGGRTGRECGKMIMSAACLVPKRPWEKRLGPMIYKMYKDSRQCKCICNNCAASNSLGYGGKENR